MLNIRIFGKRNPDRPCHCARGSPPCTRRRARPSSQPPPPAHPGRSLVPAYGSGSSLSRSSSLARSSAQVFSSHRDSDSRLSQRGFLIQPTVNQTSSLARSSAQVSRSHRNSDSRSSQRGFLIKPTVNQKCSKVPSLLFVARPCKSSAQTSHLPRKRFQDLCPQLGICHARSCKSSAQTSHLPCKALQELSPDLVSATQALPGARAKPGSRLHSSKQEHQRPELPGFGQNQDDTLR